jgi:hypothetical protein
MKKTYLTIALLGLSIATSFAQSPAEEYTATELLKNCSFEEEAKPIRNRRFGPNGEGELFGGYLPEGIILGWIIPDGHEQTSTIAVTADNLLDTTQHMALCWTITSSPALIANVGNQGIEVVEGNRYQLTFWARADKRYKGKIHVGLKSRHDDSWYACAKVKGKLKKRWKRYTITFTAESTDERAHFVIEASKPGTLYFDELSLTAL